MVLLIIIWNLIGQNNPCKFNKSQLSVKFNTMLIGWLADVITESGPE